MTARSPDSFIHGDQVIIPARVAVIVGGLVSADLRQRWRERDLEVFNALIALRLVALGHGSITPTTSVPGSVIDPKSEAETQLIGVAEAARRMDISTRAVRLAAEGNRLAAKKIDGRWLMTPQAIEDFRQNRAA